MKWSLQQLSRYHEKPLTFDGVVNYDAYVKNIGDILHMDDVSYHGEALAIGYDRFRFIINISTTMYLEDAWTLEEVPYPINIKVTEIFGKDLNNDDERYIDKNTIDLYDIIWENVLLEKPIRIVKAD